MRSTVDHVHRTAGRGRPQIPIDRPSERRASLTPVDAAAIVSCPFSFAIERTQALFPIRRAERAGRTPVYVMRVSIAGLFEHDVVTTFARGPDPTESGRYHDEVRFDCAAASRWLPDFHGSIRFRPSSGRTAVALHGTYVPRFGLAGRVLDAIVGRRIASGIAADVLRRLGSALERRWRDELDASNGRFDASAAAQLHAQPA